MPIENETVFEPVTGKTCTIIFADSWWTDQLKCKVLEAVICAIWNDADTEYFTERHKLFEGID